jgi:hypothetical protein
MLKKLLTSVFRREPPLLHVPEGKRLFRCFVRGENFPGAVLSLPTPIGFYTTRFVVAESGEAAEGAVLAMLRKDPSLQSVDDESWAAASIYFERIEKVPSDTPPQPNSGFSFFEMGT